MFMVSWVTLAYEFTSPRTYIQVFVNYPDLLHVPTKLRLQEPYELYFLKSLE